MSYKEHIEVEETQSSDDIKLEDYVEPGSKKRVCCTPNWKKWISSRCFFRIHIIGLTIFLITGFGALAFYALAGGYTSVYVSEKESYDSHNNAYCKVSSTQIIETLCSEERCSPSTCHTDKFVCYYGKWNVSLYNKNVNNVVSELLFDGAILTGKNPDTRVIDYLLADHKNDSIDECWYENNHSVQWDEPSSPENTLIIISIFWTLAGICTLILLVLICVNIMLCFQWGRTIFNRICFYIFRVLCCMCIKSDNTECVTCCYDD